jgi:hypothetical protein
MAKKQKKTETTDNRVVFKNGSFIKLLDPDTDPDLLGGSDVAVEIKETPSEVIAEIKPVEKEKIFLGYHPITGKEVWK